MKDKAIDPCTFLLELKCLVPLQELQSLHKVSFPNIMDRGWWGLELLAMTYLGMIHIGGKNSLQPYREGFFLNTPWVPIHQQWPHIIASSCNHSLGHTVGVQNLDFGLSTYIENYRLSMALSYRSHSCQDLASIYWDNASQMALLISITSLWLSPQAILYFLLRFYKILASMFSMQSTL